MKLTVVLLLSVFQYAYADVFEDFAASKVNVMMLLQNFKNNSPALGDMDKFQTFLNEVVVVLFNNQNQKFEFTLNSYAAVVETSINAFKTRLPQEYLDEVGYAGMVDEVYKNLEQLFQGYMLSKKHCPVRAKVNPAISRVENCVQKSLENLKSSLPKENSLQKEIENEITSTLNQYKNCKNVKCQKDVLIAYSEKCYRYTHVVSEKHNKYFPYLVLANEKTTLTKCLSDSVDPVYFAASHCDLFFN